MVWPAETRADDERWRFGTRLDDPEALMRDGWRRLGQGVALIATGLGFVLAGGAWWLFELALSLVRPVTRPFGWLLSGLNRHFGTIVIVLGAVSAIAAWSATALTLLVSLLRELARDARPIAINAPNLEALVNGLRSATAAFAGWLASVIDGLALALPDLLGRAAAFFVALAVILSGIAVLAAAIGSFVWVCAVLARSAAQVLWAGGGLAAHAAGSGLNAIRGALVTLVHWPGWGRAARVFRDAMGGLGAAVAHAARRRQASAAQRVAALSGHGARLLQRVWNAALALLRRRALWAALAFVALVAAIAAAPWRALLSALAGLGVDAARRVQPITVTLPDAFDLAALAAFAASLIGRILIAGALAIAVIAVAAATAIAVIYTAVFAWTVVRKAAAAVRRSVEQTIADLVALARQIPALARALWRLTPSMALAALIAAALAFRGPLWAGAQDGARAIMGGLAALPWRAIGQVMTAGVSVALALALSAILGFLARRVWTSRAGRVSVLAGLAMLVVAGSVWRFRAAIADGAATAETWLAAALEPRDKPDAIPEQALAATVTPPEREVSAALSEQRVAAARDAAWAALSGQLRPPLLAAQTAEAQVLALAALGAPRVVWPDEPWIWVLGEADRIEALDAGAPMRLDDALPEALASRLCDEPAIIAVGSASSDGPQTINERLALCRADALAARLHAVTAACAPETPRPTIWTLVLGESTEEVADRLQREVVVVGLSATPQPYGPYTADVTRFTLWRDQGLDRVAEPDRGCGGDGR